MGTSCTQLHMFYVANKSRESETGTYYNLHAFVCHVIFQSTKNNTISMQYTALCYIDISIGYIILYTYIFMYVCMYVYIYIYTHPYILQYIDILFLP